MSLPRLISGLTAILICLTQDSGYLKAEIRKPYRRHNNSERKIALTFDDGPHKTYTPEILDILDEFGIKATFFVVGCNCEENPEIVLREISSGHEIGNHTYSHPRLSRIKQERLMSEIIKTENLLFELSEYRPKLFRPPEGVYSLTVSKTLERLDYTPVLWTVDTMDWKLPSSKKIAETVKKNTTSGVIILCHDFVSGKSNTPEALREFLPLLIKEGYQFVTVSELIASS